MKSYSFQILLLSALVANAAASSSVDLKTLPGQTYDQSLNGSAADAEFGRNIAVVGDVNGDGFADLLVGAPLQNNGNLVDSGAAYLYPGTATGFSSTPIWQVSALQDGGRYGSSVAGIGDVNGDGHMDFAVGAETYDNGSNDEGVVFIYFGAEVIQTASIATLEVDQVSAFLGTSLAGAGDINGDGYADVMAGAPGYDNTGATNGGLVGVWFGAAGPLFDTTRDVTFFSSQGNARMGSGVAGIGDFNADGFADVVVGAADYTDGQSQEGAAFLYLGGAAVNTGTDGHFQINQTSADFGRFVAAAGDVNGDGYSDVLVGAPDFTDGETNEGGAFVYHGGATVDTVADQTLTANQVGASFGMRVSGLLDVNGDGYGDIAVSAPLFDSGGIDVGLVRVYGGSATGVAATPIAEFLGTQVGEELGRGLSGGDLNRNGYSDLVVGASRRDVGVDLDVGTVSIALGTGRLPDTVMELVIEPNVSNAAMGASLATGDVNGDGYIDLAIGAATQSGPSVGAGVVHLHLGSASGIAVSPTVTMTTNALGAEFGRSVAIGDLNGDGYGDLIVGSSRANNGQTAEGRVHVYFGGVGPFNTTIDRSFEVDQASAEFGHSVAFAGDVNGDGFGDLLVGARYFDAGETDEGAAFVFFGGTDLDTQFDARLEINQGSGYIGQSVAGIGDINGDGFADVAAGGNGIDAAGATNGGGAFVWFGGAAFNTVLDRQYLGDQTNGRMGFSMAGVGDVNNDGYDDFVVGANEQDVTITDSGAAFVFLGGANPSTTRHATLSSQQGFALDGDSVAAAGDINDDGFADIWVGAASWDNIGANANQAGAAFLYLGSATGVNTGIDMTITQTVAFEGLGRSMASGDFDGDGDPDFVTGVQFYENDEVDEGGVKLYRNGISGRPSGPQTFSATPLAPVDQWGRSGRADGFLVAMDGISPLGRERAVVEIEACPLQRAFGAPECRRFTTPMWSDVNVIPGPVALAAGTDGMEHYSVHHWRARLQYAPYTTGVNNSAAPLGPRVGPWRRMGAEPGLGDIRVLDSVFRDGFE